MKRAILFLAVGLAFGIAGTVAVYRTSVTREATASKPMPFKTLEALVLTKTTDEVVKRIGPPDHANPIEGGVISWLYEEMIQESPGGRKRRANLLIKDSRVFSVKEHQYGDGS